MKTKYLAILLCAAFVLPGCNDSFLDRIPLDELTDETYWETEDHLPCRGARRAHRPAARC